MFNNVAVVGVGLLGGSVARDIKALGLANSIIGVCRSASTGTEAIRLGVVDKVLPLRDAVEQAEILIVATPMQAMLPVIKELEDILPSDLIITDVGSVKTDLYQQLKRQCPKSLAQFVLAHPIAGGENSGVSASRENLFRGKHVIITETEEVAKASIDRVESMWQALGAEVIKMGLHAHDSIFAKTSHLPHVVAFSLVNYLTNQPNREELFELAASGFYDFTRIASSDAEMWRDICVTNQESMLVAIDGFSEQLNQIRDKIARLDQGQILEYFGSAKSARDAGLGRKKNV